MTPQKMNKMIADSEELPSDIVEQVEELEVNNECISNALSLQDVA